MKPIPVTTLEQAQALPLAHPDYVNEVLPSGETVRHRTAPKFFPSAVYGNHVIAFTDTDGTPMRVEYDERGPVKRPILVWP